MWQATSQENKEVDVAQERLTMRKIREILRLKHEAGLSDRAIAGACKISNSTVGEYLRRAEAAGVSWPLPEMREEDLYKKLFPDQAQPTEKSYPMPNWEEVRKELRQKGITLRLLWIEYKEKYPDGYQYSRYCEHYLRWKKSRAEPSMRHEHVGGEQMQVDYAGVKIPIVNRETGEISQVPVFVAVLPASNYTYAEAQSSENQCNWNNGHVRAMEYFGGAPRIVVLDYVPRNIIRHHPPWHTPEKGQGPLVQLQPGVDLLVTDDFGVLVAAVSQGGHKHITLPRLPRFGVVDGTNTAKIHLQLFPGFGMYPYVGFFLFRPHMVHEAPHRRITALIAVIVTQALEDRRHFQPLF